MKQYCALNTEKITLLNIFDRDTRVHLRLPFSFYLLPVFCFGLSQASTIYVTNATIVFIVLHVFIYPASNIYNSYMDNDTGSIGGIKNPPPATRKLYYASIIFDTIGLLLCLIAGWQVMLLVAGYVAFSKAYSWHGIRLKKYAYLAWLSVAVFQGGYTFLMSNMAAEGNYSLSWFTAEHIEAMIIASVLLGGSYPLTQIYQHKADAANGDRTLSLRLGIKGTFLFSGLSFFVGALLFFHYFSNYFSTLHFVVFILCLSPVVIYFNWWFLKTSKNKDEASFERTMLMNQISSVCMVCCFTVLYYMNLPNMEVIWPQLFSR